MKKAFIYSLAIHIFVAVLLFISFSFSMKEDRKFEHIQLSMEIFNSKEGSSDMARGIETSNADINIKQNANAVQNAENIAVEKKQEIVEESKTEKEEKTEIKKEEIREKIVEVKKDNVKMASVKKKEVKEIKKHKKEERNKKKQENDKNEKIKKDIEKDEVKKESSKGAVLAAKGKISGSGAGENGRQDGASKSKGGVDGVYSLKEVDKVPKSLKSVRPVYPEYAKNMRIEGYVQVRFILDNKGRVTKSHVIKAVPDNTFENAALKAVNQWKFKPARKDGKDVNVAMVVKLNFKLDEK